MLKNRIHSVLHRRGILTPKEGLFSKDGRKFLDELTLDDAGRTITKQYLTALDQFETLIDQSDKDLRKVMRQERWAKPAALLQTMPGIGVITALTILAELGDLKRFKSRAAVANYAGLVPVIRDSNTKHYSGGITHRGSAHLRAVLSEAAWTAVKRVPVYQALFERIAGRRGKQIAIVAVARSRRAGTGGFGSNVVEAGSVPFCAGDGRRGESCAERRWHTVQRCIDPSRESGEGRGRVERRRLKPRWPEPAPSNGRGDLGSIVQSVARQRQQGRHPT